MSESAIESLVIFVIAVIFYYCGYRHGYERGEASNEFPIEPSSD